MISWSLIVFIILQIFTLFSLIFGLLSTSIINFLLYTVLVILFQGLALLLVKNTILGLYLLIVYLGAIVILFAFMVLFVNNSLTKNYSESNHYKGRKIFIFKINFLKNYNNYFTSFLVNLSFILAFITTIIIYQYYSYRSIYNSYINYKSENIIFTVAEHFYESNSFPLVIMTAIMATGLILAILIIKRK